MEVKLKDKIKELLDNKGVTAYELGIKASVPHSTISRILSGETQKLGTKTKTAFAKYFQISEDYFNNSNKTEIKQLKNDIEIIENNYETEIFTNKNGVNFIIHNDDSIKIEVPLIPFEAYASSKIDCYFDENYTNIEFSKVQFSVDKIGKGVYMGFKSKNDSMNGGGINDTPSGAEILAREIGKHLWLSLHKNDLGFIIMAKNAIMHKDIIGYNKETGMFKLHSRNLDEVDFEISINDIYRIFNVIKRSF